MARRSSYASVLAGASNSPRSGFMSNQAGISPSAPHPRSTSVSAGASHEHLAYSHSRSYSGPNYISDAFDREPLPPYSSSLGKYSESLGGAIMEPRLPQFTAPSYLRHSRHVERLEEKYRHRLRQQREDGRRTSTGGGMSRSSSGVNLHKMVPSHRGMTYEIQEKFVPNAEEVVADLPTRWNNHDKVSGLEVSSSGFEVKFTGQFKNPGGDDAAAIRTDYPIPRACGIYYFEVTILSKGKDAQIGVGLSGPNVSLNRPPGWEPESYAYHGDDGRCFSQSSSGKEWGSKFGYADIIGCGINFKSGIVFFTKNGSHSGNAFWDVKGDRLYPTVGLKKIGEHIRVNLGATPFVYEIDEMVFLEREKLMIQIAAEDTSSFSPLLKENELLQRLVGQYLAHEGYTESTRAFAEEVKTTRGLLHGAEAAATTTFEYTEDLDAVNRQRIRSAILEGDVDRALKHTTAYYPSVLQDNENIYFKLRCRKFIEMIKRSTDLQPRSKRASSVHSLRRRSSRSLGGPNAVAQTHWEEQPDVFSGQMELDPPSGNLTFSPTHFDNAIDDSASPLPPETLSKQADLMASALLYGRELQAEFKDDPRREVKQALEDTFALIAYPDARNSSLAHLLESDGRVPVAEELNGAILVSLGQSSSAALERLIKQTEALTQEISMDGGGLALLNVRKDYLRYPIGHWPRGSAKVEEKGERG